MKTRKEISGKKSADKDGWIYYRKGGKLFRFKPNEKGEKNGKTRQNKRNERERKTSISKMAEEYRKEASRIQQSDFDKGIDENVQKRLSEILERRLEREYDGDINGTRIEKNGFKIYSNVKGETFREVFSLYKKHIENGELVDIHGKGEYDKCKCFLSSDGLQGLAIEPNGNIISVFNANNKGKKGWVKTSFEIATKNGGNRLDCYDSPKQPLAKIYSKYGFKEVSRMGYNMEYDHDNIAKNHNKPDIVFMAYINGEVVPMKFDKDDYDNALKYRDGRLKDVKKK